MAHACKLMLQRRDIAYVPGLPAFIMQVSFLITVSANKSIGTCTKVHVRVLTPGSPISLLMPVIGCARE
jgi:hypothetical protein